MTALVERYLAAVGRRLPEKDAGDIVAELREAILAKIEAREAELGRSLERGEISAIIKSYGSPMLAAARYGETQHLIGPGVYPYFWPTQHITVGIVAAIAIVAAIVQAIPSDNPMPIIMRGLGAAWHGALFTFGLVTVIFVAFERTGAGVSFEKFWRPEQLPRDTQGKPKSLFESLFSLAWDAIFIAWWVGLFQLPNFWPGGAGGAEVTITMSGAWDAVWTPVLVIAVAQVVIHAADIVYPSWSRLRSVAAIAVDVALAWVVWVLAHGGPLFVIDGPAEAADRIARLNDYFLPNVRFAILGVSIAIGIALAVEIWKLVRSFTPRGARAPSLE